MCVCVCVDFSAKTDELIYCTNRLQRTTVVFLIAVFNVICYLVSDPAFGNENGSFD